MKWNEHVFLIVACLFAAALLVDGCAEIKQASTAPPSPAYPPMPGELLSVPQVSVSLVVPLPPRITNRLSWTGDSGNYGHYAVESSVDLTNWTLLTNVTADRTDYLVTDVTSNRSRFYRVGVIVP